MHCGETFWSLCMLLLTQKVSYGIEGDFLFFVFSISYSSLSASYSPTSFYVCFLHIFSQMCPIFSLTFSAPLAALCLMCCLTGGGHGDVFSSIRYAVDFVELWTAQYQIVYRALGCKCLPPHSLSFCRPHSYLWVNKCSSSNGCWQKEQSPSYGYKLLLCVMRYTGVLISP